MAENASASLPAQMQTWKEMIALYRLLDKPDVTFEALMQPHWQQTCQEIALDPVVLLVQDTTELDLTQHPQTTGLGQVGNERGRGLYLQTMLAVLPEREPCWAVRSKNPLCGSRPRRGRRAVNDGIAQNGKPMSGCGWSSGWAGCPRRRRSSMSGIAAPICSVLQGVSGDPDPFSGAGRSEPPDRAR